MDWKRLLNPWAMLRQAEAENAALTQKAQQLWDDLRNAERKAYYEAQEHFEARTKHLQMYTEFLLKQMVNMAASNLPQPIICENPEGNAPS